MDLEQLSLFVALLATISVAAERIVAIIQNCVPQLRAGATPDVPPPVPPEPPPGVLPPVPPEPPQEPPQEWPQWARNVVLQLLTIVASIIVVVVLWPVIEGILPPAWKSWWGVPALGLLGSGGSAFWNSFAGSVANLKNLRQQEALKRQAERNLTVVRTVREWEEYALHIRREHGGGGGQGEV